MPSRQLDFPVFDADNHMYETTEALTKFLPEAYTGLIDYVEVKGRTKIAVKGQISDYIPNPTFDRVAAPGRPGGVLQESATRTARAAARSWAGPSTPCPPSASRARASS